MPQFSELKRLGQSNNTQNHSLNRQSALQSDASAEPIAIIGIGCRFPGGANDPHSFWQLLCQGVDAVADVPADRWNTDSFYHPKMNQPGKTVSRCGGFINDIDQFDAQFFGISPREAMHIDPQQRLLMEVCWEAFEDAGQVVAELAGQDVSVFMGAFTMDQQLFKLKESNRNLIESQTSTGSMMTLIANRLSHAFDFRGPSVAIDTACSSSLVAVHLACQGLRNKESSLAVAGGVNAMFLPEFTIVESKAGMLSPQGRCKTFDADADGYVRAEGGGVVVLKPLSRALADGDSIYAVIRGSAVNQDGRTNGITVPRGDAQQAVMRAAYKQAAVSPAQVRYMEAHGTGTPVGDPIEANAIGAVLSEHRALDKPCYIGSVKTNIGHTEAAAGIAGLIKAALSLYFRQIPPHLHLRKVNPNIQFDALGLQVPTRLTDWPTDEERAFAGVNSFGFGGTNAHVVLEEASHPPGLSCVDDRSDSTFLLPLSARSPQALRSLADAYRRSIADDSALSLYDIGYTQSIRRDHHSQRLAVVANNRDDLARGLTAFINGEADPRVIEGIEQANETGRSHSPVVFVFTGMGPQWWAMGQQLLDQQAIFREAVEQCDALFSSLSGWSLLDEMTKQQSASRIAETMVAQPANFAVQVGLATLWQYWGIQPDAIVGHSTGEVAAAYVSGAMSLETAVQVIFHRSRLQQRTTGQGKLVAVGMSAADAQALLTELPQTISIAAINSPGSVTLAGALEALVKRLEEMQVFHRVLKVNVPYHSHCMDPLKDELLASLRHIECQPAKVPLYSTAIGELIDGQSLDADYWWKNIRFPVRFADAMKQLLRAGYQQFLELGPHPALANSISECAQNNPVTVLPSLRREDDEMMTMLTSLGHLYTKGRPINWARLYPETGKLTGVRYPWQHERYWLESSQSIRYRLAKVAHPLLGHRLNEPLPSWQADIDTFYLPYLLDHQVQGWPVFPGAAYLEVGLSAACELSGDGYRFPMIEDLTFHQALFLNQAGETTGIRCVVDPQQANFTIYRCAEEGSWPALASGRISPWSNPEMGKQEPVATVQQRCPVEISHADCYQFFSKMGLEYGQCFSGIKRLRIGNDEVLAEITIADDVKRELSSYRMHPAITDLCLQTLAGVFLSDVEYRQKPTLFLPVEIRNCQVFSTKTNSPFDAPLWVHARIVDKGKDTLTGNLRLVDAAGKPVLILEGCRLVALAGRGSENARNAASTGYVENAYHQQPDFYELQWIPIDQRDIDAQAIDAQRQNTWIVFMDKRRVGEALVRRLRKEGYVCIKVFAGERYRASSRKNAYRVNPTQRNHFDRLLASVSGMSINGIIHMWSVDESVTHTCSAEQLETIQQTTCLSVLHLVQALADVKSANAPRLWLVTRGSQAIDHGSNDRDNCTTNLAAAPLWGLARVLGHREYAENWGGIIDLDPRVALSSYEARQIYDMVMSGDGEDQLAIRCGRRYALRLSPALGQTTVPLKPVFRRDASYLITGGLGGLGLIVARWLIQRGARHLILMGRRKMPPRSDWNALPVSSPVGKRIAAVRQLEALGATVHLASVDVADEAQLTNFLTEYGHWGWPAIRGIIHAAGVAYPQPLSQIDGDGFIKVMRPKMLGAWLLHRLFEQVPLDCFLLFSSVASVVAMDGQGNYAAGNAFMDALAQYRRANGLPALSINWGPWTGVGLAAELDLIPYFAQRGILAMTPEQGIQMMERSMLTNWSQITVLSANWRLLGQWYPMEKIPPMVLPLTEQHDTGLDQKELPAEEGGFMDRFAALSDPNERLGLLEDYLINMASKVLRFSTAQIDPGESLIALGIDSMMAGELKNHIEKNINLTVTLVDILKGVSVRELAMKLRPNLEAQAADMLLTNNDSLADAELDTDEDLITLLREINNLSEDEQKALIEEMES